MESGVVFTDDEAYVLSLAEYMADGSAGRKFFVHGRTADVSSLRPVVEGLGFETVSFDKSTDPENAHLRHRTEDSDLWMLYHVYPSDIMDENLRMHQDHTKGVKLVVDDHPFCGRGSVWPIYFPFSYVTRALIGYPHAYAFRDATDPSAWDVRILADKVRSRAQATSPSVFGGDIDKVHVSLTSSELTEYERVKEGLFETEKTPRALVRKLKGFVDSTDSMRQAAGKGKWLPMHNLDRVWPAYRSGVRRLLVSDAKVDRHLEGEFDAYIANANGFLEALHG